MSKYLAGFSLVQFAGLSGAYQTHFLAAFNPHRGSCGKNTNLSYPQRCNCKGSFSFDGLVRNITSKSN